ncbi:sugar 3,4-ketoisomerase [Alcanivorax sediminis]|uniref:WxcM-like domain-containing protein n=1 Tax=Alcanivorax sediminis TaxID=2663008 RepID=A0A6N7M2H4_9GAMM|nr:FdtA/QdtA family cupin domain-containing protein [Alcanivorax sediminis]MQX54360.1 WxcM-like domain-containing protein [Alcanivorax sediminis]
MSLARWHDLPYLGDGRGGLVAVEGLSDVPFEIRRVYYIFDTERGVSRGFHAHKELKQLMVCVSGRCEISLDDGKVKENVTLDSPKRGIIVESMMWREMHNFSENCVLLVMASDPYDESDYIRDYREFLEATNV